MITIAFIRETVLLTNQMVAAYVAAQQTQVSRDFAPAWGTDATCVFVAPGQPIPPGSWQLIFKDHSDQDGDLGYHSDNGTPTAYVFVADDLANHTAWTVTASHETLEMLADPACNRTVDVDGVEYCWEVADACEDDSLAYLINGHLMTDFVLPSWFDTSGAGRFTFRDSVRAPLQLAAGGYIGFRTLPGGAWQQRFAEEAPVSPRQRKGPMSRTMRRFGVVGETAPR